MKQKNKNGKKLSLRELFHSVDALRVMICALGVAVIIGLFEVAIVPMRYNLQVGMVPTTTISATKDVVDELSTEQKRKEAAAQVTPTYRYQEGITEQVMSDFDRIFGQLRAVRQYAGTLSDNSSSKVYTKEELQYARDLLTLINLSDYQLTSLMRCKTEELEEAYTLLYAVLQSTMQGHVTQGQESTAVYNIRQIVNFRISITLGQNIVPAVLNACIQANMLIDQEVPGSDRRGDGSRPGSGGACGVQAGPEHRRPGPGQDHRQPAGHAVHPGPAEQRRSGYDHLYRRSAAGGAGHGRDAVPAGPQPG